MQDMLSHGLALNTQALSCVTHALQNEGQVWKALQLLMLTNQVGSGYGAEVSQHLHRIFSMFV